MNVRDMIADVPTGLFTGGQWRLPSDGGAFPVIYPATKQLVAMVSPGTEADAIDAVGSAAAALEQWGATAPRVRAEILRRAFNLLPFGGTKESGIGHEGMLEYTETKYIATSW
jgi:succinate-semialdehyde dehydrogenase / glutarate-semialdehyde dehydrogenase